jgi:hypothetical protein
MNGRFIGPKSAVEHEKVGILCAAASQIDNLFFIKYSQDSEGLDQWFMVFFLSTFPWDCPFKR